MTLQIGVSMRSRHYYPLHKANMQPLSAESIGMITFLLGTHLLHLG